MRAGIYTANPTAVALGANAVIPLGSIVRRYGCGLDLNGNGINVSGSGFYAVDASISYTPTAAGLLTVQLLADGVAVPGALATVTGVAGDTVNLSIVGMIRRGCDGAGTLTLTVDQAGTLENAALIVERVG